MMVYKVIKVCTGIDSVVIKEGIGRLSHHIENISKVATIVMPIILADVVPENTTIIKIGWRTTVLTNNYCKATIIIVGIIVLKDTSPTFIIPIKATCVGITGIINCVRNLVVLHQCIVAIKYKQGIASVPLGAFIQYIILNQRRLRHSYNHSIATRTINLIVIDNDVCRRSPWGAAVACTNGAISPV